MIFEKCQFSDILKLCEALEFLKSISYFIYLSIPRAHTRCRRNFINFHSQMTVYAPGGNYMKNSGMGNEYWPSCSPGGSLEYDHAGNVSQGNTVLHVTSDHQNSHISSQYTVFAGHSSSGWLDDQYDPSKSTFKYSVITYISFLENRWDVQKWIWGKGSLSP